MVVEKLDALNLESYTLLAVLKWVYLITAVRAYGLMIQGWRGAASYKTFSLYY
jgi:hypothetical protein